MTWRIWWILICAVASLKVFTLMGYFCRKYVMFELKKYRGTLSWKMTYSLKNDISHLVNFHTSKWRECWINPLYIMFYLKECNILAMYHAHQISTFRTFYSLSGSCPNSSCNFLNQESVFCINFAPFCNILAKT